MNHPNPAVDCSYWYGIAPRGCDVPHWVPFLDAEVIGIDPHRKLTLPLEPVGAAEEAP